MDFTWPRESAEGSLAEHTSRAQFVEAFEDTALTKWDLESSGGQSA